MINIAHRTSALALLALLMLGVSIASQAQVAVSSDRKVGEIFVAIDSGQYRVLNHPSHSQVGGNDHQWCGN
jgi:hypothetical protein